MSAKNKPMSHLTPLQAMAVARAVAVESMPYFRTGILNLVPRETPGLGTLGLTKNSILMYDPEVLKTWTPTQAGAVIVHEYMHQFLDHEKRFQKLKAGGILQDTEQDRKLWNECCDGEINDDLVAAGLDLPSWTNATDGTTTPPVLPSNRGWPENRLAEEYAKIEKSKKKPPSNGGPDPGAGVGGGHCGSCAAHAMPDEPEADDPDGRSDVDQQIERKQVCEAITEASKQRGKVPLGLQRFADEVQKPAKIPWQQKLGSAMKNAVSYRPGAVDYTMKKPSRRQAAMSGLAPMEPRLPGMHAPIAEVAMVLDTSGSISDAQVKTTLAEVDAVIKHMAGAKITFCACDAEVHSLIRTRSLSEVKVSIKGGGGTDFRPAFAALEAMKPRPSVVVFATDGYGDYPAHEPKGMKVIWLNIGGQIGVDWGEVIDTQNEEDDDA